MTEVECHVSSHNLPLTRRASFCHVGAGAAAAMDALHRIRAALDQPHVTAAASPFDGKCVLRIMENDVWPLRHQLTRVLLNLRDAPLPQWMQHPRTDSVGTHVITAFQCSNKIAAMIHSVQVADAFPGGS